MTSQQELSNTISEQTVEFIGSTKTLNDLIWSLNFAANLKKGPTLNDMLIVKHIIKNSSQDDLPNFLKAVYSRNSDMYVFGHKKILHKLLLSSRELIKSPQKEEAYIKKIKTAINTLKSIKTNFKLH